MTAHTHSQDNQTLGALGGRVFMLCGVAGLVLLGAAAFVGYGADDHWHSALKAYIWAFSFVTSICLGALFFVMIQHLVKAGWSVVVRRVAEALAGNLRWLWIFFIPIALGMWFSDTTHLYHWAVTGVADPLAANYEPVLGHKAGYLNPKFWIIRQAGYFLIWGLLAHYFLSTSRRQDQTGDPRLSLRMAAVAAPGVGLYFLTQTFAAIDWIMTLEPHWFSTMFGVYFFAASACGFYALMILIFAALQRSGRLTSTVTAEHFHDLGKLLFAFGIVFWAYIAYSQFMLIWYANLPEETNWFIARILGQWEGLSYFLLIGHFAAPFLAIISRHSKRHVAILSAAAAWMLVMHMVDLYWLVMPQIPADALEHVRSLADIPAEFREAPLHLNVMHPLLALGMLCLGLAGAAFTLRQGPLIPQRDPRLPESLAFENM